MDEALEAELRAIAISIGAIELAAMATMRTLFELTPKAVEFCREVAIPGISSATSGNPRDKQDVLARVERLIDMWLPKQARAVEFDFQDGKLVAIELALQMLISVHPIATDLRAAIRGRVDALRLELGNADNAPFDAGLRTSADVMLAVADE